MYTREICRKITGLGTPAQRTTVYYVTAGESGCGVGVRINETGEERTAMGVVCTVAAAERLADQLATAGVRPEAVGFFIQNCIQR